MDKMRAGLRAHLKSLYSAASAVFAPILRGLRLTGLLACKPQPAASHVKIDAFATKGDSRWALAALLLFFASASFAGVAEDALKDVLQDKVEGSVGQLYSSQFWGDLVKDMIDGNPEETVYRFLSDYEAGSLARDVSLDALFKLVPGAKGPLDVFMLASEAAHSYTRGMLDFYQDQYLQGYSDSVLRPSSSPDDLKRRQKEYARDIEDVGGIYANVLPTEREELKRKFAHAYTVRMRELEAAANAAKAKRRAAQSVAGELQTTKNEAKSRIDTAVFYLKAARGEFSKSEVLRYLNDKSFAANVQESAATNVQAAVSTARENEKAASDAKKRGEAPPPAKPVPPLKINPSGTPLERAAAMEMASASSGERNTDFSKLWKSYGELTDAMAMSRMDASAFWQAAAMVSSAAQDQLSKCREKSANDGERAACRSGHEAYAKKTAEMQSLLDGYAAKLKESLSAFHMEKDQGPLEQYKLVLKEFEADGGVKAAKCLSSASMAQGRTASLFAHYRMSASSSGLKDTLKDMEAQGAAFAFASGSCDMAYDKAVPLSLKVSSFITAYQDKLGANMAAYADMYGKQVELARYAGIKAPYAFKKETEDLVAAKKAAQDPDSFSSPAYPQRLDRARAVNEKEALAWKEQREANERFLALAGAAELKLKAASMLRMPDGKTLPVSSGTLNGWYDTAVSPYMTSYLRYALLLLSPSVRGDTPTEMADEKLRVWDLSGTPSFLTPEGHEARLKEGQGHASVLRSFELDKRLKSINEELAALDAAYAGISARSAEARARYEALAGYRTTAGWLAEALKPAEQYFVLSGRKRQLSADGLDAMLSDFSSRIEGMNAVESAMAAVCRKYAAAPPIGTGTYPRDYLDVTNTMSRTRKWSFSRGLREECNKMDAAVSSRHDIYSKAWDPVAEMTVMGTPVPYDENLSIEVPPESAPGGRIELRGKLKPETLPFVARLKASLDRGNTYDIPVTLSGGEFSFSFRAEPGKNYEIRVSPELSDGKNGSCYPRFSSTLAVTLGAAGEADIKAFYERFREAYEGRSLSRVMSMLSDSWEAGDGTTLADLEENLRSSFRLYDSIAFSVSGLKVRSLGGGRYAVSYEASIKSRIYSRNLVHEEKSSVEEELSAEKGSIRVTRTLSGRYWQVR